MARFLFVVPPFTGHINPTLSVGRTLAERGHRVAWVGHPSRLRPLLREDERLFALEERLGDEALAHLQAKSNTLRGLAAMKFLWEDVLVPLGMLFSRFERSPAPTGGTVAAPWRLVAAAVLVCAGLAFLALDGIGGDYVGERWWAVALPFAGGLLLRRGR